MKSSSRLIAERMQEIYVNLFILDLRLHWRFLEEGELFPIQIYNDIRNLISTRVHANVDLNNRNSLQNEASIV